MRETGPRAQLILSVALALSCAGGTAEAQSTSSRALVVGQHIKVEGRIDGTQFHAREITLRDSDTIAKVEGPVEFASVDKRRLIIMGFAVSVPADAALYRGSELTRSRALLVQGAWVEVKGTWSSSVLEATRVRIKDAAEPTEELEGSIESMSEPGTRFVVLGRQIIPAAGALITDERTGNSPVDARLRRDDDDNQGRKPLVVGPLVVGGRLEGGFLEERGFDADDPERQQVMLSRVQVLASAAVTESIEAYAKATLAQNVAIGRGPTRDAQLSEAYVVMRRIGGLPVDVQIGRQRFRDSREWFFDEYMDAVRVGATLPRVKLEAAVTEGLFAGVVGERDRSDQRQFIGSVSASLGGGLQAHTYLIARNDVAHVERPVWIGGTLSGRMGAGWSFWQTMAIQRGWNGGTRLAGWAMDGGFTRRFAGGWAPALTLGYARGSGNTSADTSRSTRFRQTDLEDNQSYYGGIRRLALYGDLLDPELSNVEILTAGLSLRPNAALAFEAIYHRSLQLVPSRVLPSSSLDGALTGLNHHLGDEIDLVLTIRAGGGIDIDLAGGVFLRGPAFGPVRRPAFFWRPQIRTYF